EVADGELARRLGLPDVDEVLDEHAERRAPVPAVVLPDDGVAGVGEHAGQGVADHGRAQVPDVHLLGDVRMRVVDDDALGVVGPGKPQTWVGGHGGDGPGEVPLVEGEVDEARPGQLDVTGDAVQVGGVDHRLGQLPRWPAQLLG